jgi:HrpA-like RNA helicase
MHKMEIVSTLSGGSNQNAEIRKRAERLGRMTTMRSDASDVLSSTGGGFNDVEGERAARLITASQPLSEEPSESELARIRLAEFLKTYTERTDYDPRLPITRRRADIIAQIKENQFSIIVGGTGCGKTTQVPQYILDEWSRQGNDCNIVVTQPRRIAAISVARRVCDERRWRLGDTCGYQIGLDRENVTEKTRICYVTTGVLLQKLISAQNDPRLANVYTHIILDEVHERDLDTDFVLLVLKLQTYCRRKSNVKVVLMSATIDTRLFAEFFAQQLNSAVINLTPLSIVPAPVLEIECSTYRVQEFYWDDLTAGDQSPVASYLDHVFVRRYQELYRTHGYVEFEQLLGRQKPFNK